MMSPSDRRTRQAMTLMEVIVALGLSVALMTLIGSALQFYATTLRTRDDQIRQTAIARGVMSMISADLRACAWSEPQDLQVLKDMLSGASALTGGGASGGSSGGSSSQSSGQSSSGSDETTDDESMDDAALLDVTLSYSSTTRPGLIGTSSQLQFDVSRLPRVDQMTTGDPNQLPSELTDVPSDLKTISYHIQSAGYGGVAAPLSNGSGMSEAGLVRRILDREVSRYANEMGDVTRLAQTGSLVAPEVTGIEFSYWDGTMWLTSWHSDDMGALPIAIKVRISVAPVTDNSATDGVLAATSGPVPEIYESIVRLPMASAVLPTSEDSSMDSGSSDTSGSTGGSSSSSSGTGGTGT